MNVSLTVEEFDEAWLAGEGRHRHHCKRRGQSPRQAGLRLEGVGAVAEAAVCKWLGGTWEMRVGEGHYGKTDVVAHDGTPVEVKSTYYPNGRLFVYTDTPDSTLVVLAIVDERNRSVRMAGWLRAHEAKKDANWQPDLKVPCFAVEQPNLYSIETFPCSPLPSSSAVPSASPTRSTRIVSRPSGGPLSYPVCPPPPG